MKLPGTTNTDQNLQSSCGGRLFGSPAFFYSNKLGMRFSVKRFSLTPALSRGERENNSQMVGMALNRSDSNGFP